MRRSFVMRKLVSLLALWLLAVSTLGAAPQLRTVRNQYFEVLGLDLRSVSYVSELSVFTAEIAQRYLKAEGMDFPQPILLSLRPEIHVDFEGDYRVGLGERNSVQLDVRWEDDMTLQRTCRALAEALLRQYSLFNYGRLAATNLRAWPVEALADEIYYGLRSAEFVEALERRRKSPLGSLQAIVARLQSEHAKAAGSVDSDAGYWLLTALKSSHLKRDTVVSLFQQATAGRDIEQALTTAIQPSGPTAEPVSAEDWFHARMADLLEQEYDVIESMDTSRDWLTTLANLQEPFALESGEKKLNLRSLWLHRADPAVQERVRARYEILLLRMARINPAYYNPARSLGVLFESILQETPSHLYLHHLTIYLSDWEDAKEMQAEIIKHL
tara:strand:- start:11461 stop:12615 length:1155 start_codon:yes stop_codon:yes gene_type:complete